MNKINSKGFVLAETLVVTVFLMLIFSMIYRNFYPLIGEYNKREGFDDVDSKYATFWFKKMIEDSTYSFTSNTYKQQNFAKRRFMRFECDDFTENADVRENCKSMVKAFEINGCDANGNGCDVFITDYQIGPADQTPPSPDNPNPPITIFKENLYKEKLLKYQENCFLSDAECKSAYITKCMKDTSKTNEICTKSSTEKVFVSKVKDYIETLPDYVTESLNYANYRVIIIFHHTRYGNDYYTYSTMEINK